MASNSPTQAQRFLDIYSDLERHFRKELTAENIKSFSVMVKELSKTDRVVERFRDDLLQWHDLRNAIVHERRGGGQVIAEPIRDAVDEFALLAGLLTAPPKLTSRFQIEVARVSPDDMVSAATRTMRERGFAQLPVYDGSGILGLLTAVGVTRWLGQRWESAGARASVADATVADVLKQADDRTHWLTLGRDASYLDAIHAFDSAHDSGEKLAAIILTHDGKRTQKPIGILTAKDLPELMSEVIL